MKFTSIRFDPGHHLAAKDGEVWAFASFEMPTRDSQTSQPFVHVDIPRLASSTGTSAEVEEQFRRQAVEILRAAADLLEKSTWTEFEDILVEDDDMS